MDELPFAKESLDLIWSEGAIYNMGFKRGIASWKQYLKPGGVLAVSEITWTTDSRPPVIEAYWKAEYPEIGTASEKLVILKNQGYESLGHFMLPSESWTTEYYKPLAAIFPDFLERHEHSALAQAVIDEYKREFELYDRYREYYSYGFYVAYKKECIRSHRHGHWICMQPYHSHRFLGTP